MARGARVQGRCFTARFRCTLRSIPQELSQANLGMALANGFMNRAVQMNSISIWMSSSPVVHLPQSKPGTIQGSHLDWKTWKKWEGIFQSGKSQRILNKLEKSGRASSSYFFLFFPIFLSILLFFLFFSNFLLFFLFFSYFTYNKQIFVRDLNILSLFKYVVYRVH